MLYIMRHGKTGWNAMRKLQGRTDIPLNEEGRQMAEQPEQNMPISILISATALPLSEQRKQPRSY